MNSIRFWLISFLLISATIGGTLIYMVLTDPDPQYSATGGPLDIKLIGTIPDMDGLAYSPQGRSGTYQTYRRNDKLA